MRPGPRAGSAYESAGVSIEAGDRAVALMRDAVARTAGPEVIGGIGGFAGLFDASRLTGFRRPLLATATDGVGTKVVIAQRLGRYGTVGSTWSRWWWTTWSPAVPSRCS
jgi:phosphoribosylformylglycinamidine cyclo-ligase